MAVLPYARLLRLPNVFTAFADIGLGLAIAWSAVGEDGDVIVRSLWLFLASGCIYLAGMVWNDYFDYAEDRIDRGFRPLPSGQISLRRAAVIGSMLLAVGWGSAAASGLTASGWQQGGAVAAAMLIVCVLLYDAWIKRTRAGPLGMGACRFLNVLLGLTLVDTGTLPWNTRLHVAAVVGVYIVGVTWFARTEEKRSRPQSLRSAAAVIGVGLALALALPVRVAPGASPAFFPYLLVIFGFWIGTPIAAAVSKPLPLHVQAAVKRCIFGLVVLDSLLASVFVGPWGLMIVLLLPPAILLGKWVYST